KDIKVQTAGNTAGEFLRMVVNPAKRHSLSLEELGFTPPQLETIKKSVRDNTGVVLMAAPKGMGQTSLLYAVIRSHDAYLQHIHSVEREPDQDLEGITQNKLAGDSTPADE